MIAYECLKKLPLFKLFVLSKFCCSLKNYVSKSVSVFPEPCYILSPREGNSLIPICRDKKSEFVPSQSSDMTHKYVEQGLYLSPWTLRELLHLFPL